MALGNILGSVLQGMLSGQGMGGQAGAAQGGTQANPLAGVIAALLTPQQGQAAQAFGSGGLADLVQQFRGAGMGQQVDSWVGTGPNQALEPKALEAVFGGEKLGAMASEAAMPKSDLMSGLAAMLPDVINGLTPQGRVPDQQPDMQQMIVGVLGQFLGGRR
ncbi:YidB family protein [Elioraea sp.]|uniref:YidB family protein n=1 Tax=Elioraea sp. TaxID=2185103 RepID=UPI0025C2D523|nr:YidB family protein [Elioraea sp.]